MSTKINGFNIKCDDPVADQFKKEAAKLNLTYGALFRNIFFFWKQNSEPIAKLNQDLISGKRKIVDGDK